MSEVISTGDVPYPLIKELQNQLRTSQKAGQQTNLYVTGDAGCGKTILFHQLRSALEMEDFVYSHLISCKQLIGKFSWIIREYGNVVK